MRCTPPGDFQSVRPVRPRGQRADPHPDRRGRLPRSNHSLTCETGLEITHQEATPRATCVDELHCGQT